MPGLSNRIRIPALIGRAASRGKPKRVAGVGKNGSSRSTKNDGMFRPGERWVRILVVDDDLALARGLSNALRHLGFAVDHTQDGEGAAQVALSEPYCLIVLDLGLPGVSGFKVLEDIRKAGSTVPVMILTARDAMSDKVKGLDLGADDYLSKPFDLPEFEARVRALVRRPRRSFPAAICGSISPRFRRPSAISRLICGGANLRSCGFSPIVLGGSCRSSR
jgi:CheY-like chemotaxis protein